MPPDAVDAIAFESQARGRAHRPWRAATPREAACLLRAALDAWRGSALTDVAAEEFAFAPAARLAELRAAATLDRIDADIALGAADAALIGELRELTAADPLAERPAALLMRALAATGRQSEALGRLPAHPRPASAIASASTRRPSSSRPTWRYCARRSRRRQAPPTARAVADTGAASASPRAATAATGTGVARDAAPACAARRRASSAATTTWPPCSSGLPPSAWSR